MSATPRSVHANSLPGCSMYSAHQHQDEEARRSRRSAAIPSGRRASPRRASLIPSGDARGPPARRGTARPPGTPCSWRHLHVAAVGGGGPAVAPAWPGRRCRHRFRAARRPPCPRDRLPGVDAIRHRLVRRRGRARPSARSRASGDTSLAGKRRERSRRRSRAGRALRRKPFSEAPPCSRRSSSTASTTAPATTAIERRADVGADDARHGEREERPREQAVSGGEEADHEARDGDRDQEAHQGHRAGEGAYVSADLAERGVVACAAGRRPAR